MSTVTTKQNNSDTVFTKQYSYYHGNESNATTNMVGGISYKLSSDKVLDYSYNYTDTGNVENVYENGKKVAVYTYDELNQLVWYADTRTGRYIRIVYDNYGNIQRMESYLLGTNWAPVKLLETRTYSYGDTNWKDKLTEFDGDSITYDRNGNPLTYRDDMTFEWENGRILKNITTSDKAIQMSYDSNGMRTQKSVDGVKTNYYYDSNKNLISLVKGNDTLLFYYDSDGSATSFSYNGTMYFYVKNLQGDVVRIIDLSGTEVASYVYDAWGNIKDTKGEPTIREINPIRYRSYVYDTETSLYYLQSRYYDPFAGRFLNADEISYMFMSDSAIGSNAFSYCDNNSINAVDSDGFKSKKKHFDVYADFVSWGIDLIITFVCPGASIAYDVVGFSLKRIFRRLGFKKSLNFLLKSAIPKCKGMFSRFFTVIRTLIWCAAGITINWLQSKAVSKFFDKITKYAEKLKKMLVKLLCLLLDCFPLAHL